jgi:mono/diheme cytochrome c family protein
MVRRSIFCLVISLFLLSSAQQNETRAQRQEVSQGTLQISWVDPEEVSVRFTGPGGYADEAQVTGGHVFTGLASGVYQLTASKEGYQSLSREVRVRAGETASTTLVLQQQAGQPQAAQTGTLQLTWVDPGEVTVQVSGPEGYSSEAEVTGGHIFTGLPAGSYTLSAAKEGYESATQTVQVSAGATASTSLTLARGEAPQGQPQDEAEQAQPAAQEGAQPQEVSFETLMEQGEQLYSQAGCSSCHGGDGGGNQGPALAGNEQLQETDYVAGIILHGRGGMPGFGGRLSDAEIASVGTYIRNSWENDFGPLSPQEVQGQR